MDDALHIGRLRSFLYNQGIVPYAEDDLQYLLKVARLCARTAGVPVAGAGAVMAAGAGSVTLPVIGAIPGAVAGALAGFVGGTMSCVIARGALKPQLDQILQQR